MDFCRHAHCEICYVVDGRGAACIGRMRFSVARRNLFFIPAGLPEMFIGDPAIPTTLLIIRVAPELLEHLDPSSPIWRNPMMERNDRMCTEIARMGRRLLYEQTMRLPGFRNEMKSICLHLLTCFFRHVASELKIELLASKRDIPALARVRDYIPQLERQFFQQQSLDLVAAQLGMSRRHFTECFRMLTGGSWHDYLRLLRISHAKFLLTTTRRSILTIGFECGFDSPSTFYRSFKQTVGMSAKEWRETQGK